MPQEEQSTEKLSPNCLITKRDHLHFTPEVDLLVLFWGRIFYKIILSKQINIISKLPCVN